MRDRKHAAEELPIEATFISSPYHIPLFSPPLFVLEGELSFTRMLINTFFIENPPTISFS